MYVSCACTCLYSIYLYNNSMSTKFFVEPLRWTKLLPFDKHLLNPRAHALGQVLVFSSTIGDRKPAIPTIVNLELGHELLLRGAQRAQLIHHEPRIVSATFNSRSQQDPVNHAKRLA